MTKTELRTPEGKAFLLERYERNGDSAYILAKELDTHTNYIYRTLKFHKIHIRDKGEAQKLGLQKGTATHPTKGKERPMDTKNKIGDKLHKYWSTLSEETLKTRVDKSRELWYNVPEDTRKKWQKKSHVAIRKAAEEGSKAEKMILAGLLSKGYKCQVHKKFLFPDSECSVDIYMPLEGICIELNGPSHMYPIWGEERFKETVQRDLMKVEQLLAEGFAVVAIQNPKGYYSKSAISEFLDKFIPFLKNEVINNKKNTYHEILIGDV